MKVLGMCHLWRQRSSLQPEHKIKHQLCNRRAVLRSPTMAFLPHIDREPIGDLALSSRLPQGLNCGWEVMSGGGQRRWVRREMNGDNLTQYPSQENWSCQLWVWESNLTTWCKELLYSEYETSYNFLPPLFARITLAGVICIHNMFEGGYNIQL